MPGIYFRNDFNTRLQVSGFYSNNGQVGQSFLDKSYNYGALHQNNGNVMSIINNKDSSRTQTFAYDALNRITSGSSAAASGALSWGENYSIDPWGNLMISPMGGKTNGGNFQHAGTVNNQATGLGYDAAGNLTNYTAPGQYVYDPENRIQSTAGVTYTYDADGNRVEKSGGSVSTLYWYGAPGIIAESDLSGTLKSEYVFFNGKRLARIDLLGGTVHYYLSDHLNSTSMVINGAGTVEDESDYSPFGTEYALTSSGLNHYKFTSKERDTESQLDYFGARYYSNGLGRFITPDWAAKAAAVPYAEFADPQSLNLYTYVRNNSASRADTDGHEVDLDNKKKADRNETQRRMVSNTSKAEQKLFKAVTDPKTGKTELKLTDAAKSFKGKHTTAYTRLAEAIGSKNTVSVGIHDTYTDGKGQVQNTPPGGITIGPPPGVAGNATVSLNSKGMGAGDMSVIPGTSIPAPTNIIAAHEVMGHGLEILKGGDPTETNVRNIENQMRQEEGLPPRPIQ